LAKRRPPLNNFLLWSQALGHGSVTGENPLEQSRPPIKQGHFLCLNTIYKLKIKFIQGKNNLLFMLLNANFAYFPSFLACMKGKKGAPAK